jgi:hypothetical protein
VPPLDNVANEIVCGAVDRTGLVHVGSKLCNGTFGLYSFCGCLNGWLDMLEQTGLAPWVAR